MELILIKAQLKSFCSLWMLDPCKILLKFTIWLKLSIILINKFWWRLHYRCSVAFLTYTVTISFIVMWNRQMFSLTSKAKWNWLILEYRSKSIRTKILLKPPLGLDHTWVHNESEAANMGIRAISGDLD